MLEVRRYVTLYPVYPHTVCKYLLISLTHSMMQTVMLCRQHIKYNRRILDQHESSDAESGNGSVSRGPRRVRGPGRN